MSVLILLKQTDQKVSFHLSDEAGADIKDATGTIALYTRKGRLVYGPLDFAGTGSPATGPDYSADIDGADFDPPEGSDYYLEVVAETQAGANAKWRRPVIVMWGEGDA